MQMMHSTYDEKRILDWIAHQPTDKHFTLDTVIDQLAPISFGLVDYVLSREFERGSISKSHPTGRYYVKKESNNMSDTEKRLSYLEFEHKCLVFKHKQLEDIVAKDTETVDTKIKNQLLDIEVLLKKISDKVDALPEKKQRLQHNRWIQTVPPDGMLFLVDVMLASGEVVFNMRADQVPWKYYPDDPNSVVAWRYAE